MITGTGNRNKNARRGRPVRPNVSKQKGKYSIFVLVAVAVAAIGVLFVLAVISDGGEKAQAPIVTPWPTLQITPVPPTPTPTPTPTATPAPVDDTSYQVLQGIANNGLNNQTPNDYKINLTGNSFVDYTALADMYPWVPNRYNDSSPHVWMHSPGKFKEEMNGQGEAERIKLYELWKQKQIVKAPSINLEILHNDDVTPYDFNKEAIVLGKYYDGYFRFTNTGDKPFQGDIAVAINASIYVLGQLVHMENIVITDQYLSLYPGQSNDFYKKWYVKDFNGAPIPTGCLNIVIELRDKSDGSTLYSQTIKPIIAKDINSDGYLST